MQTRITGKKYQADYYQRNKEKIKNRSKAWYLAHTDKAKKTALKSYAKNKTKIIERVKHTLPQHEHTAPNTQDNCLSLLLSPDLLFASFYLLCSCNFLIDPSSFRYLPR